MFMCFKKLIKVFFISENDSCRDNWIANKLINLSNNKSIIDCGAGEQKYRKYTSHLSYTSQDFCKYDGFGDHLGLQTKSWDTRNVEIISDICSIPIKKNSYDYVLCSEVLEHVYDPVAAIRELDRILKVGGEIIITAPFRSFTHFSPYHFCDGFNKYFYEHHLDNYEFIEITAYGDFYDSLISHFFLMPRIQRNILNKFFCYVLLSIFLIPLILLVFFKKFLISNDNELTNYGFLVHARKIH